ncbi:MAG: A/G-specific adenine glycosylase [Polynucleobacter sp. 24-46-87]|jgi:A/G-specific adenine glycosylase|uniref:A/G-specific adenine glycosylase n=1 Tax=unclassified Polynucleobacter TaxID=2640945 RepID=UPI000BDDEB62|nr:MULTISPECIES: A/G-specific adenine glycosylase [unclassified Polynucleobacter]OYY20537.1 MAG: A/G-specific adenine glycosylase [Polynucleobacter sp. 35-46-11]OZA15362.1 MAG: A/G-specific adenine glycosylase [Polynucleobacter sp. 24-46-87]OZA77358.1 MAG: A/G-specific adenine glycosylase [Polynucleobacter sp. 39-46-10]
MSEALIKHFAAKLIAWHGKDGRQGLPWQSIRDPYAVWVSEIMLQQTQVATVLERYPRFMKRFPTVKKLAAAPIDDVLAEWAGLGYYTRARNLHACAKQVMEEFEGKFPQDPVLLEQLKGIGRSTAGAIAAFAFHKRAPILDANVKRILARLFGIEGAIQEKAVNEELWSLAKILLPKKAMDMPVYTQALMDFGATWCTSRKPVCLSGEKKCPFEKECQANLSDQVLLLPHKVAKAKSPEFDCDMLLLRHSDSVLLQRRPDKAIWGGLWSLPESAWRAKEKSPKPANKNALNMTAKELLKQVLPDEKTATVLKSCQLIEQGLEIKHIFTHRRLWIQIWHVTLSDAVKFNSDDLKWVPLRQLGKYGLPQPIKLLLQGLNLARDGELRN